MAGFYPDALANRFEVDRDGTLGFRLNATGSSITALTTGNMQGLNDESDATAPISIDNLEKIVYIFPELRDVLAVYMSSNTSSSMIWESSTNTTNGQDGTWLTVRATALPPVNNTIPGYRTQLVPTGNNTSVKAIRIRNTGASNCAIQTMHVYGIISAASPDKLEFWHPTLNQALYATPAILDWGDFPRNTIVSKTFRLKNSSATLTAGTITVGREALTDSGSPTKVSETEISYNGGSYGSTASVSSLAPGAISAVFTVRKTSTLSSFLGLWSQRIYATAVSWT